MQTSGTCPPLSDGVKTTIVTTPPARRAPAPVMPKAPAAKPATKPATSTHRAGGHAKHARRAK